MAAAEVTSALTTVVAPKEEGVAIKVEVDLEVATSEEVRSHVSAEYMFHAENWGIGEPA